MNKKIIWVASYPKSGNTWMRSLLANLFYLKNNEFNFNILKKIVEFDRPDNYNFLVKKNKTEFNNLTKLEVISKYWLTAQKGFNENHNVTNFFKTHSSNISYMGNKYTSTDTTSSVIYLVRDPRDVVISYSKHLNMDIDQVINILKMKNTITYTHKHNYPILLSRWDYHVNSWSNLNVPTIFIKYEHLIENTEVIMKQLIQFFNEKLSYNLDIKKIPLKKIIKNTSFENLKKKEMLVGFPEATKNTPFFRSGKKDQWKDILTKKQEMKITKEFNLTMKKLNYL